MGRSVSRVIAAAVGALAVLTAFPASADPALTPLQFREAFTAALRQRYPHVTVTPLDETVVETRTASGGHGKLNLSKPYDAYLKTPGELDSLIRRHVDILEVALSDKPLVTRANLSVRVGAPGLRTAAADEAGQPISRPLAGDIAAYLWFALTTSSMAATRHHLQELGLTVEEAWELARRNDENRAPARGGQLDTASRPDAIMGDNAFARLVSNPAMCGRRGKGDPRMFLYLAPNVAALADPAKTDAATRFWGQVREVSTKPDAPSRTPITCATGQWTVAAPPS